MGTGESERVKEKYNVCLIAQLTIGINQTMCACVSQRNIRANVNRCLVAVVPIIPLSHFSHCSKLLMLILFGQIPSVEILNIHMSAIRFAVYPRLLYFLCFSVLFFFLAHDTELISVELCTLWTHFNIHRSGCSDKILLPHWRYKKQQTNRNSQKK